ncbi:MAG: hypothetical protein JEY94_14540 [Melioribacteraceae bacterium]|nr:hypothetical protein [Melioribacteraceae bacterium]
MEIVKQYIIQSISRAANNLRISSEKIEVVALLKEQIKTSENLELEIAHLKKITEFSKLAIKLWRIYLFIAKENIDFLKLSDQFKEHTSSLVRDLSNFLDVVTPSKFIEIIESHKYLLKEVNLENLEAEAETRKSINESVNSAVRENEIESQKLKEEMILNEIIEKDEKEFEQFEETILAPIKSLDSFLERLNKNSYNDDELVKYENVMNKNADLSELHGFEILKNMHRIFAHSIKLIKYKEIIPVIPVVEGMRACLIVIVAVVRNKDVDISAYLTRAENFGKEIRYTIKEGK